MECMSLNKFQIEFDKKEFIHTDHGKNHLTKEVGTTEQNQEQLENKQGYKR